ncbi:MAG: hypothetical protein Fur0021_08870 [Candidatus Promineifilaceae bacterium]
MESVDAGIRVGCLQEVDVICPPILEREGRDKYYPMIPERANGGECRQIALPYAFTFVLSIFLDTFGRF